MDMSLSELGSRWWTGRPVMLRFMESHRVGHDWATDVIWSDLIAANSLQSCLTLCHPIDGSPPGSPIPGIFQGRTLEWVAISFSNSWKWKVKSESEIAQLCPTLSDPLDCSLPGSPIHRIFQARVLEWGCLCRFSACVLIKYKIKMSFYQYQRNHLIWAACT